MHHRLLPQVSDEESTTESTPTKYRCTSKSDWRMKPYYSVSKVLCYCRGSRNVIQNILGYFHEVEKEDKYSHGSH
jgi:hypothetical protein